MSVFDGRALPIPDATFPGVVRILLCVCLSRRTKKKKTATPTVSHTKHTWWWKNTNRDSDNLRNPHTNEVSPKLACGANCLQYRITRASNKVTEIILHRWRRQRKPAKGLVNPQTHHGLDVSTTGKLGQATALADMPRDIRPLTCETENYEAENFTALV